MRTSAVLFTALLALSCNRKLGVEGASCVVSADCEGELQCMQGVCRPTGDAAAPPTAPPPSLPPPPPAALTQADCNAFADKVVDLTAKSQDGAAAELARGMLEAMKPEMAKECLEKGTRAEIECALRATTMDALERCGGAKSTPETKSRLAAFAESIFSDKPSEADCRAFADKVVELTAQTQDGAAADLARSMLEGMKPEMVKECTEKGTRAEVKCALAARAMEDLERCGGGDREPAKPEPPKSSLGSLLFGGGKPSRARCEAFADKVINLTAQSQDDDAAELARSMLQAMKPEMIQECMDKGTESELDCALRASTMEDLERCGNK